jgi:hypothetical protein
MVEVAPAGERRGRRSLGKERRRTSYAGSQLGTGACARAAVAGFGLDQAR